MQITPGTLTLLAQGFNAAFLKGFEGVQSSYTRVAMIIPSTSDAENYGWMKDLPGMREWVGQRVINNLEAQAASLKNKKWEHTIGVKRDSIEDDKLGIYANMFAMQGEIAGRHPDDLVWGLLPYGFTTKGFDGQYFFDSDHVGYGRDKVEKSWSNVQAGAAAPWFLMDLSRKYMLPLIFQDRKKVQFVKKDRPDDDNVFMNDEFLFGCDARYNSGFGFHQLAFGSKATLNAANFEAAQLALSGQFRPDGSPLGVDGTVLVCGASTRSAAKALLEKEYLAGGENNVNYKAVELLVVPWLE